MGAVESAAHPLALVQDQPVKLCYVKAITRVDYGSSTAYGRFFGTIEVENIDYEKHVLVHYTVRNSGVWQDLPASYLRSLNGNKEVWEFESEEVAYPSRLSADFQFAIRYDVAGATHWDNNDQRDYKISTGPRPIWPTDLVLGKSAIALRKAVGNNSSAGNTLEGLITLKNLAYDKTVRIVYTMDGWDSFGEGFASYSQPLSNASEAWYFSIPLGGSPGQVMTVEFAILYEVDGQQIWDNNFLQNYVFEVPGTLE